MVIGHPFDKKAGTFIFREPRELTPHTGPERLRAPVATWNRRATR
ncbi:hypothetical protein [Kitasatospora herbaricolor]